MPASGGEKEKEVSLHDSGEDTEDDESEILEESPCGRWQKRRVKVCLHSLTFGNHLPGE